MQGHHQEVWGLALSPNGDYVVSASHDKSLRLWERTREPLVLEEEREMVRVASFLPKTTSRPVFSPAGRFLIFHCGRVWLRTWQTCWLLTAAWCWGAQGWLATFKCCLEISGGSTTGVADACLSVLLCRCLVNLLSALLLSCFPELSLYSCGFLQVCWLQSLTFSYSLVLLSSQVCFGGRSAGGCCGVESTAPVKCSLSWFLLFQPWEVRSTSVAGPRAQACWKKPLLLPLSMYSEESQTRRRPSLGRKLWGFLVQPLARCRITLKLYRTAQRLILIHERLQARRFSRLAEHLNRCWAWQTYLFRISYWNFPWNHW